MILSDVLSESILRAIFHNTITAALPLADLGFTSDGSASPLAMALHTGVVAVGDAQTVNEVSTGAWPAYARVTKNQGTTDWALTGSKQIDNNTAITWAANNGSGAVGVQWVTIGTNVSNRVMFRMPLALEVPKPFSLLVDASDTIQCFEHGFAAGAELMFYDLEGSTLPGGITDGVLVYVRTTNLNTNDFQITATAGGGGSAIAIATAGTGIMTGGFVSKVGTKSIGVNDTFGFDATGSNRLTVILR